MRSRVYSRRSAAVALGTVCLVGVAACSSSSSKNTGSSSASAAAPTSGASSSGAAPSSAASAGSAGASGTASTSTAATSPTANAAASKVAKQDPNTLTLAIQTAPITLDPALAGELDPLDIVGELAYDSLIKRQADGTLAPDLATSWGYVGTGNTTFDLTLRSGVKFADGSALTAQGVKDFFTYFGGSGGIFAKYAKFASVTVTGPLTVEIKTLTPTPNLPDLFTQDLGVGDVISPTGLTNTKALGASTAGAGQYVLNTAQSVTGQTYTFTPNANYWNASAIHWKKIVVKVIPNASAALDALQSGQIDYMFGTAQNADAAKAAGFTVTTAPDNLLQIGLMDRNGEATKALGDVRVRQALNDAVDRQALATALYGNYAKPSGQFVLPGTPIYQAALDSTYTYDPAKAKALLAAAGFPNGFSLSLYAYNLNGGESTAAQAVASYWQKIGVKVSIASPTDLLSGIKAVLGKQYGAQTYFLGSYSMYNTATNLLGPDFYNPWFLTDPTFQPLIAAGAAATETAAVPIYQQLNTAMVNKAWFVPLLAVDKIVISRPTLSGIQMTPTSLDPDPVDFTAAS